jgi:hypothetical protein
MVRHPYCTFVKRNHIDTQIDCCGDEGVLRLTLVPKLGEGWADRDTIPVACDILWYIRWKNP